MNLIKNYNRIDYCRGLSAFFNCSFLRDDTFMVSDTIFILPAKNLIDTGKYTSLGLHQPLYL